jgi:hypothetical protein
VSVAPMCAGRMERNASASEVRSEGETMSDCNLLWNCVMYMNICSLQCKNREMRMGKRRTIRKTNKECKMQLETSEKVKNRRMESFGGSLRGANLNARK